MSLSENIDWDTVLSESLDDPSILDSTDEHKLSNRLHKTEEEVERYMVDENLSETDRAIHLLRNGVSIQKHSVVGMLLRASQENSSEMRTRVLPTLLDILPTESVEMQNVFGRALVQLVDSGTLPAKTVENVAMVGRKLLDRRDEDTVDIWSEVVITAIKYMPLEMLENIILPEVLLDGSLGQPSAFRLWCARVIGAAAPRLGSKKSQGTFFQRAMRLCQDTDYEVRACMCEQLDAIARAVGHDITKRELLPELIELIMDEETIVRQAAIENSTKILDFIGVESKVNTLLPVWRKLCEDRPSKILTSLARELGVFMWKIREHLGETDMHHFITFYRSIITAAYADDEAREMCAFNFPAIVKCASSFPQGFETFKLDQAFEMLTQEANSRVRRRMAAGLHEVAEILAPHSWTYLRGGFLRLFGDPELEVYHPVFCHLGQILVAFSKDKTSKKDAQMDDLLFLILRRERDCATNAARHNWRLHQDLLEQFRCFPEVFGADLVHGHCVPLLFKLLYENVVFPIKTTIVKCLAMFLRKVRRWEHRERLVRQMHELKDSPNYHIRLLFLELCEAVLSIYSLRFFKETFFHTYLELVKDPVANVRLRVISLLPDVRRAVRNPADSALKTKVTEAVDILISDEDSDVSAAAKALPQPRDDDGAVFVDGGGKRGVIVGDILSRSQDSLDKQKEEEEQRILMWEKEMEEAARKRDMDEARQEFAKRFAEKEGSKKGKIKGSIDTNKAKLGAAGATKRRGSAADALLKSVDGTSNSSGPGTLGDSSRDRRLPSSGAGTLGPRSQNNARLRSAQVGSAERNSVSSSSGGSIESSKRMARSASTSAQTGIRKTMVREGSEEVDAGRLPGLASAGRTGLGSPRNARGSGGGTSGKGTGARGGSPPSLHPGSVLAPLRRSQELLNHGSKGTGPSSAAGYVSISGGVSSSVGSNLGAWSATSGGGVGAGRAKGMGKPSPLSPLPRSGGGREGEIIGAPSGHKTLY